MTREEYIAKMKEYNEKQQREWEEMFQRYQKKFVNQVIKKITNRIEEANPNQYYVFSKLETEWISTSILFKEKLDELRKKYDFLDIQIKTYAYLGCPNEIRNVYWRVKGE